jgi:cytochrome c biogenesis protein CcdA
LALLPAALLLGALSAVGSCCNLPILGALAGYSGSLSGSGSRRGILLSGLFFVVGTVLALAALGAAIALGGQVVGASMGVYWKLAAGLIIVLIGVITLDLLPVRLPSLRFLAPAHERGFVGSMIYGLAMGGGSTACSVGCNPVVAAALVFITLHGEVAWGAAMLGTFALGYSLPLAAGLVGIGLGLGKLRQLAIKAAPVIRIGSGVLLVGVGFYLLATI